MEIRRPDPDERIDIDTDEEGNLNAAGGEGEAEDTAAEIARAGQNVTIATKLQALADIAERECTKQQLDAARLEFREWMRNHAGHNGEPMSALALRLQEMGERATTIARGLVVAAAIAVLAEGREGRSTVPTMDAPSGDLGLTGKGKRKGKKAPVPKKSKRSTAWISRLGSSVVGYRAEFGVDDTRLLEMLQAGGFKRRPEEIMSSPEYGFCPIDDPSSTTTEIATLPIIGADPEWVVWGIRRDAKTGCPTHRFRFEAEAEATKEASAAGKEHASAARIKELTEARVTAWYRTATPQTTVWPVTWHRPTWTLYVHSDNKDVLDAAWSRVSRAVGSIARLPNLIDGAKSDGLARTELRSQDVSGTGTADLAADLLLWLVGRQLGGTGALALPEARLEWWLEDAVQLERSTADDKRLRVKLGGAPAEGGSLAAALADGATLKSARVALRVDEQTWKVTITAGVGGKWALPLLTKPDGTPAGLDAAVDERLRSWQRGAELFEVLVNAYIGDRFDKSSWHQRVNAFRAQLGMEMVKRWGFDSDSRQGFLFAHMLPGEQTTLASVVVQDARETTGKGARGRNARDASNGTGA